MVSREKPKRVILTIKLNSFVGRIALTAAMLLFGTGLAIAIFSHLTIRAVADQRIIPRREALILASERLPNSPRILSRLAETEISESASNGQLLKDAQIHAARAANLSPWDYRNWRLLGVAHESDGKLDEAEKAIRMAARFAPNNLEVNWVLANFLLRQGKLDESIQPFQAATNASNELLPIAFDLLWQASNGEIAPLGALAGQNSKAQLIMTRFLAEQSQTEAAIDVYRRVENEVKLNSPDASWFISQLIKSGKTDLARQLWLESVTGSAGASEMNDLIWNGSFERERLKEFHHFDWVISPSDYARIGFDRSQAHDGSTSLKLVFAGRDTTKLQGEIRQLVLLRPNVRYRFECYAKVENLVTPEGPRLAILGPNGVIVKSEPVVTESTEWQHLIVDFTMPPNISITHAAIVRIPRFSYDDPTKGTVWFDDFKLTEH